MSNDIIFERRGVAGFVTLNRPHAFNAITDSMIRALTQQLTVWEHDEAIKRVVVCAEGEKAFSAGGDIRSLYENKMAGTHDLAFFAREYALNHRIAHYPKPYVALVNGIAMGGGVGVSFHGSHVITGPNASFAMPEVGIGFFPDIGASHFLARLKGNLGLCLGLTGLRVQQGDMLWSGLATHATQDMTALAQDLAQDCALRDILARHGDAPEPGDLALHAAMIEDAFGANMPLDIVNRLDVWAQQNAFAESLASMMRSHSPTSLMVAHRQLRQAEGQSLAQCLATDYRIVARMLKCGEFYEGIRAAIIDKDRSPAWSPACLSCVSSADIAPFFEPLDVELVV